MSTRTGLVMDIDHFAVHDGPGIRTCVYLKGCPLGCMWCHSPESQSSKTELLFAASRCTNCGACRAACKAGCHRIKDGLHVFARGECTVCGDCVKVCNSGALSLCGKFMTSEELGKELLADRIFFENSGGGVTVTGGEAMSQPEFLKETLSIVRSGGVHIILETSGCCSRDALLDVAELVDHFYFDFKLGNPGQFKKYTGGEAATVAGNLTALREITDAITLRLPLIPGITDTRENVQDGYLLAATLGIKHMHLLPYNASAPAKYDWLERPYPLPGLSPRPGLIEELLALAPKDLHVSVV